MAERKIVPFDEFYYQLKLMHLFLLHPVFSIDINKWREGRMGNNLMIIITILFFEIVQT
jgi:hypothetical protein